MDPEIKIIKQEMMQEFGRRLDEITSRPLGTLSDMEVQVAELKTEMGRKTLEKLIALKKTQKTTH